MKKGIYKIAKCNSILKVIAPTRKGFFHNGRRRRLAFSLNEFIALNISAVTRMESDIVVALRDISFVNISQPISGKSELHWWKCVCDTSSANGCSATMSRYIRVGRMRSVGRLGRT